MITKTQIIKINTEFIDFDKIENISQVLVNNGVIAYPTDTFYGFGVKCYSPEAIRRICHIKKRKELKPIPVFIADLDEIKDIAEEIPASFSSISKEFWPGPLTLVLKASSRLPEELTGLSGAIGIRLPDIPWLRELIRKAKFPITATSANISGEKEITQAEKVIGTFMGKVDLIIDGGKAPGTKPSTVVDLTSEKPRILRKGAVSEERLQKYLEI
ncbi:MAG: L-threonylcarbamoyladenylate synthase [Candidatus Aminicenantaceae bacterium]